MVISSSEPLSETASREMFNLLADPKIFFDSKTKSKLRCSIKTKHVHSNPQMNRLCRLKLPGVIAKTNNVDKSRAYHYHTTDIGKDAAAANKREVDEKRRIN